MTDYLVDTTAGLSQVIADVDGAGTVTALYVRGAGELLEARRGTTFASYLADGLWSVRELADSSGTVSDARTYTAFGETVSRTGTDGQPYGFAVEAFDATSGLSYNRARWYDLRTGRLLSTDLVESNHPFTYGNNNPVNMVDPSGNDYTLAALCARRQLTTFVLPLFQSIAAPAVGTFYDRRVEKALPGFRELNVRGSAGRTSNRDQCAAPTRLLPGRYGVVPGRR